MFRVRIAEMDRSMFSLSFWRRILRAARLPSCIAASRYELEAERSTASRIEHMKETPMATETKTNRAIQAPVDCGSRAVVGIIVEN